MATVTFQNQPVLISGSFPKKHSIAPDFALTKTDLTELRLSGLKGKRVILNIFPSLDTPTCAMSVRTFNKEANALENVAVLCISMDLPFAQARFCGAESLDKVIPLSTFRHPEFGKKYGVTIGEGKLAGLLARAIVIIDDKGKVIYTQLVDEITHEPDYAKALAALA